MRDTERAIRDLVGLSDRLPADDNRLIGELEAHLKRSPRFRKHVLKHWDTVDGWLAQCRRRLDEETRQNLELDADKS